MTAIHFTSNIDATMEILPDLKIISRIGHVDYFSGIDSINFCLDRDHFDCYKYPIEYRYNQRGFRDDDWPTTLESLRKAIWCIGDSFTVGIGQPMNHTWPQVLARKTNRRTINISMDGASNEWIARRAAQVLDIIKPQIMVIMWSYWTRRERKDANLSDEERRLHHGAALNFDADAENFRLCRQQISSLHTQIHQIIIPNFSDAAIDLQQEWNNIRGPDWPRCAPVDFKDFSRLPNNIKYEITHMHECDQTFKNFYRAKELTSGVIWCQQLDHARDGHHFDLLTAEWLVDQVELRLVW